MSLQQTVKKLTDNKRRFVLMRISGLDTSTAMKLTGVTRGTYNSWTKHPDFNEVYSKVSELQGEYRQEAIQLLRRDNQLEAALLEGKIIAKLKEEVDTGEYDLLRSHVAREILGRLLSELDATPQVQQVTWAQKIQNLFLDQKEQLTEGETTNDIIIETVDSEETKPQEGFLVPQGQ